MNRTTEKQVVDTFGALQVMLGQVETEGLGFSMDAGLPVPHFGKTRLVVWKLPRLLDRMPGRLLGRLLDIT